MQSLLRGQREHQLARRKRRPTLFPLALRCRPGVLTRLDARSHSPDDEGDRTGFLNRTFKDVYAIRRVGKRLKAWDLTYYLVRWAWQFGALFAAVPYVL